jgi:hypothetical protein
MGKETAVTRESRWADGKVASMDATLVAWRDASKAVALVVSSVVRRVASTGGMTAEMMDEHSAGC